MSVIDAILAFLKFLNNLADLWKEFKAAEEKKIIAAREARAQAREKAIAAQQAAKSEDEFDKAQDDIVRNSP